MAGRTRHASTQRKRDGGKLSALGPHEDGKFTVWDHENAEELARVATFKLAVARMLEEARK